MTAIGKWNTLRIVKEVDFGVYLDGGEEGEILMPSKYIPAGSKVGDEVSAFIYLDSEDRLIATTEQPFAQVGDFALLEVVALTDVGAFMDWGLLKDLFIPFREQKYKMEEGKSYVVYIFLDDLTGRIIGSSRIEKFLDKTTPDYAVSQEVELMIYSQTDIGYKAIINNTHTGVLFNSDVFRTLHKGEKIKGFIKRIRPDTKIDLVLEKPGYGKIDDLSKKILDKLREANGYLALNDNSPAEEIYDLLGMSKKNFKKALGSLYKAHIILLEEKGIRLNA